MFVRSRVFGTLGLVLALLALIPPWCVPVFQTPRFSFPGVLARKVVSIASSDVSLTSALTQVPRVRFTRGVRDRGRDVVDQ
jgi:hypothetical protein